MICKICNTRKAVPYNGGQCMVCSGAIRDGVNVVDKMDRGMQGVAFMRNGADQWLVLWKTGAQTGHFDIVHNANLRRLD